MTRKTTVAVANATVSVNKDFAISRKKSLAFLFLIVNERQVIHNSVKRVYLGSKTLVGI